MKSIIRWMLCHTIILVLLIFVFIAYYFRGPILGIEENKEPELKPITTKISSDAARTIEKSLDRSESIQLDKKVPVTSVNDTTFKFRPKTEKLPVIKEDLLQSARKAYWNDELERAKTLYYAYIDLHQDQPDGYGELGNLLSTMGDLNKASEMYRKAAVLLTKQGKVKQAKQLQEVLNSIEVIQNVPQ